MKKALQFLINLCLIIIGIILFVESIADNAILWIVFFILGIISGSMED